MKKLKVSSITHGKSYYPFSKEQEILIEISQENCFVSLPFLNISFTDTNENFALEGLWKEFDNMFKSIDRPLWDIAENLKDFRKSIMSIIDWEAYFKNKYYYTNLTGFIKFVYGENIVIEWETKPDFMQNCTVNSISDFKCNIRKNKNFFVKALIKGEEVEILFETLKYWSDINE